MMGIIDANGQVQTVTTWIDHPIVGDMPVVTKYTAYKDTQNLKLGTHNSVHALLTGNRHLYTLAALKSPPFTMERPLILT